MTWRKVYPLLLIVVLTQGCQRDSASDVNQSLKSFEQRITSLDATLTGLSQALNKSPSQDMKNLVANALALARARFEQNDYNAAHDMLLAAMRLDPSSPDVFALGLAFLRQANTANDDEVHELAHDLFIRVDGLIPFQPLDRIAEARKQYNNVASLFEKAQTSVPVPSDPFASIMKRVDRVKDQRVPAEVRSQLLQRMRGDLETLAVEAASQEANLADGFWTQWTDAKAKLEQAETETLTSMYTQVHSRVVQWSQTTLTLLEQSQKSATDDILTKILEVVQEGYRLRRDLLPYAEAAIPQATQDQKTLDQRADHLERVREWLYNQQTLSVIKELEGKDSKPVDKLKQLVKFDERRLLPYVSQRYQSVWNEWFGKLQEDQQKIEVTKLRIMREITP